ncbi:acyl-CoA N-acyltransferase [Nitzschia inconspicua]|uniref:Acyl-CoA N-acyltransferase n=1 Tax=Nitzschia inconspicua TaxID=303405 RepID=A0A9K3KCT0_9STRA|nr:acyl-CoA N-acyltransferase [Nitzschia inconspicua]
MKSKDLKLLRKKMAVANKLSLEKDLLQQLLQSKTLSANVLSCWKTQQQEKQQQRETEEGQSSSSSSSSSSSFTLFYSPSQRLSPDQIQQCLGLFQDNMSKLYQDSSWGLNLDEKRDEFLHSNARFLILQSETTTTTTTPQQQEPSSSSLAAFVHFRFEYDDEESPTCAVLYVYEIQVQQQYRGQGIGKRLMEIVHTMGRSQNMSKVVLTVFQSNVNAMRFYRDTLGYTIDDTSPSRFGQPEDYEILSLSLP